ncbi:MAG TPA: hypothetical protein VK859_09880 [bacterium]|jgi:hypothetical protein|nr:hypothetical protein [bacterium]
MKSMFLSGLKYMGACLLLFAFSFMVGTKVLSAEPTLLHLDFQDELGQPVSVTQATLVLVARSGNYIDKLPLKILNDGLDLPLDPSWLKANWPGVESHFDDMDRAYIFLKAPGYAPICSNPIHWIGTESDGLGKDVVISFPRGKTLVITRGEAVSFPVSLRKAIDRFLKLSDGKGNPLVGVHVKSYVYWSQSDHGNLDGSDFLSSGISDATGRIPVTDGDFIYAFQVTPPGSDGNKAATLLVVKRFESKEYPVTVPLN